MLHLTADLTVIALSRSAQPLIRLLRDDAARVEDMVTAALDSRRPAEDRYVSDTGPDGLWLVAIPMTDSRECLLVGRDTSLPDRMTEALLASRSMLKKLLAQASDLAFELDERGCISFITPGDFQGCETESWLGKAAADIFWDDGSHPPRLPFERRDDGTEKAVAVHLTPVGKRFWDVTISHHGDAERARQLVTVHDVTDRIEETRRERRNALRLALLDRITHLLHAADNPQELLSDASQIIADVLRADFVWIVQRFDDQLVPLKQEGALPDGLTLDDIPADADCDVLQDVNCGGRTHLLCPLGAAPADPSGHLPGSEGYLLISRDTGISPWSADERELAKAIAVTMGAALKKALLISELEDLSRRDGLTQLMNRRAFEEAVTRRLKHQLRTGKQGALIFVDLDHFKEVNDTLGHEAGDNALKQVAIILESIIRPADYAGRFGGDEFVIWLEEAQIEDAAQKGEKMIAAITAIRETFPQTGLKFGASVGVVTASRGASLDQLIRAADVALYEAKRGGRGAVALAPAPDAAPTGAP